MIPKIAFDIDGVTADVMPVLTREFVNKFNYDIDITRYDFGLIDNLEWTMDKVNTEVDIILRDFKNDIEPFYDTHYVFQEFYQQFKTPIVFITSRPEWIKLSTLDWLYSHFFDTPYKVYFTDIENLPKQDIILREGLNGIIEDNVDNINEIAPFVRYPFLVRRSYNEGLAVKSNVNLVNTLSDVLYYCKRLWGESYVSSQTCRVGSSSDIDFDD